MTPLFTRVGSELKRLFRRAGAEQELDAELHDFLEASVEAKVRSGMNREAAMRAARMEIGSFAAVKDQVRDVGWQSILESVWQDVLYAFRSFSRSPGFAVVVVTTMALGIGATTAIFSVVDGLLLRSLPYPEPHRLVWVWGQRAGGPQRSAVNPQEFLDYRSQSRAFAHLAAVVNFSQTTTLTGSGEPASLKLGVVSGNYFDTLGVRPLLGRALRVDDEQAGRSDVAVLSHGLWQRVFNGSPSVAGSSVTFDDRAVTIVGVMPADFLPPQPAELWMPMPFFQTALNRQSHFMRPIGRLHEDVTLEQAQTEMDAIARRLEREYPATSAGWSLGLVPLETQLTGSLSQRVWLLFGAAAFLLLIGCANIAGLLLARATSRVKEVAVRAALGAGRRRIVRQLLTESLLLALFGSALGVVFGYWLLNGLLGLNVVRLPSWAHVAIDHRVFALAIPITILTALLFGLLPAIEATRFNLVETLKASSRTGSSGVRSTRIRSFLVIAEVAVTVILLVGAGLFMRSLIGLQRVDPGFVAADVLTFPIDLPQSRYPEPQQVVRFYEELEERLTAIPGSAAVGMISQLPLSGQMNDVPFVIEGRGAVGDDRTNVDQRFMNHDYLRAMSIPLLRGRSFSDEEARRSAPVTLISQRMVERFFPDENPIGQRLHMLGGVFEIVGVVGDVRHRSLAAEVYATVYVPTLVVPNSTIVIRTGGSTAGFGTAVQAAVRSIDKDLALSPIQPLERVLDASVAQPRSNAMLLNAFAALALALALIGVYGVVAYTASQRAHEFGIRMALGATRRDIEKLVVGVGARLTVAGAGVGLVGAVTLARMTTGLLFGVHPTDPATYLTIAALLAATVLLACWLPARRAADIGPLLATRGD